MLKCHTKRTIKLINQPWQWHILIHLFMHYQGVTFELNLSRSIYFVDHIHKSGLIFCPQIDSDICENMSKRQSHAANGDRWNNASLFHVEMDMYMEWKAKEWGHIIVDLLSGEQNTYLIFIANDLVVILTMKSWIDVCD